MAVPIKLLCMTDSEILKYGLTVTAVRTLESKLVDVSSLYSEDASSDPSYCGDGGHVIYQNQGYDIVKSFTDIDKRQRILFGVVIPERLQKYNN